MPTSPTPPAPPISTPAGFAPAFAMGFADQANRLAQVSATNPLPVALPFTASGTPPLSGEAIVSLLAGPFTPDGQAPVTVTLGGDWSGEARLKRSTDEGATLHGLRVAGLDWGIFTANGSEQVWSESEDGATFWLDISLTSGTCSYRVSQ